MLLLAAGRWATVMGATSHIGSGCPVGSLPWEEGVGLALPSSPLTLDPQPLLSNQPQLNSRKSGSICFSFDGLFRAVPSFSRISEISHIALLK